MSGLPATTPVSTPAANTTAPSVTAEVLVRARVISDDPLQRTIPVTLRRLAGEPHSVRLVFPAEVSPERTENEWVLPRGLLETGLHTPAHRGGVHVWPCGRVQVVMEFHAPEGVAVVQFDSSPLRRFLRRTAEPEPHDAHDADTRTHAHAHDGDAGPAPRADRAD
ncbi:SsgA family sporulation/cell division regulator [Streptomyces sp. BI20]|uniref:SsgA family sporulation/cell division regulator n=1 Tax=Streptomyces sp. BI20 TaxID=3403460 RepID=UPI003C7250C6